METPNWLDRSFPVDALALPKRQPLMDIDDGHALAQAIVDTTREPLLVLDKDLRVITASRSFSLAFGMKRWFHERVGVATGRVRRIAIVALARKLIVALWRFLEDGVIPHGATTRA